MSCADCGDEDCLGYLTKWFEDPRTMTYFGLCAGCDVVTSKHVQVQDCPDHGPEFLHVCCRCWDEAQRVIEDLRRKRDFMVANGVLFEKAHALMDKRLAEIKWPW